MPPRGRPSAASAVASTSRGRGRGRGRGGSSSGDGGSGSAIARGRGRGRGASSRGGRGGRVDPVSAASAGGRPAPPSSSSSSDSSADDSDDVSAYTERTRVGNARQTAGDSGTEACASEGASSASSSQGSLVDGLTSEDDGEDDDDRYDDDDAAAGARPGPQALLTSSKRRRMPATRERLRKWRRLTIDEREVATGEAGIVWRAARAILRPLSKQQQQLALDALRRALSRVDATLEKTLVPPAPSVALDLSTGLQSAATPSALYSWRAEQVGKLVVEDAEQGDEGRGADAADETEVERALGGGGLVGFAADIAGLEALLLPEATETLNLARTLEAQERELISLRERLGQLRAERRRARQAGRQALAFSSMLRAQRATDVEPLPGGVDLDLLQTAL